MNFTIRHVPITVLALAGMLTFGGCAMTTPPDPGPQKTGQQLRAEIVADATAAIGASGIPDGWALGTQPGSTLWDADAKEFIGVICSTTGSTPRRRFELNLYHASVGDPVVFANRMGDYWSGQGLIVSTVVPTVTGPGGRTFTENRADRPGGGLAAGATAQEALFVLSFYTECSTDPTLDDFAGPSGYREYDMLEPSPYHPKNSPTITPYPSE